MNEIRPARLIQIAETKTNIPLCCDHYRLTLRLPDFPAAQPGQFLHISPATSDDDTDYSTFDWQPGESHDSWWELCRQPMLRRAFSIAGLRRDKDGVELDLIYRVVGVATNWMASLSTGHPVSVLGPLGNLFPIHSEKPRAWLVAGGVGLPPMLWLAEALSNSGKQAIAFCGGQRAELLPLSFDPHIPLCADAGTATHSVKEFAQWRVPVVISTDDGSAGFPGRVGDAMAAYHERNAGQSNELVVYTCGPELMMRFVAEYCRKHNILCYVCMERNMACGTGTCQSCVVAVAQEPCGEDWTYRLCCMDGPVFPGHVVCWNEPRRLPSLDSSIAG